MDSNVSSPTDFVDNPALPGCRLVQRGLVTVTLGITALVVLWLVIGLMSRGGLAAIDYDLIALLHENYDTYDPIGPQWFDGAMRDITALGSNTILAVITTIVAGLLVVTHRVGPAVMLVSTSLAAYVLSLVLKVVFDRTRPDFVADSVIASSSSFPSSHALLSAVVYLLIAAIAAREMSAQRHVVVTITAAVMVIFAVGFSRIYLGAHWPSDVLAGWLIGVTAALAAWQLARAPTPPPSQDT